MAAAPRRPFPFLHTYPALSTHTFPRVTFSLNSPVRGVGTTDKHDEPTYKTSLLEKTNHMSIQSCSSLCARGMKPVRMTLIYASALFACAVVTQVAAISQTTAQDLEITDWREPGAPRPNGQITAWFKYNGASPSVTADAVLYRGSIAAETATQILRKPLTLTPGAYVTFDSGPTVPFNEGDIFTVCIDPDHTVADAIGTTGWYESRPPGQPRRQPRPAPQTPQRSAPSQPATNAGDAAPT